MLRFYDTARRAVVDFVPRTEGQVSMYVCGATPYSEPHLGHGGASLGARDGPPHPPPSERAGEAGALLFTPLPV